VLSSVIGHWFLGERFTDGEWPRTSTSEHDANARKIESGFQANRQQIRTHRQNLEENRQRLRQLRQRFSDLGEYDAKSTSFVHFAVGSSVLTPQARKELSEMANDVGSVEGYLTDVKRTPTLRGLPR